MKRKLAVLLTAATVFSAILPTTCMAAEKKADIPEGTTISFWHAMGGVNGEALDYLVNKFNEENEYGIKVDSQYQGEYDDEINKLKSAQLGNMGADLVQIYDIGTRFMIDSGWVIPMQDMIDSEGYDVSDLEPNITAYYTGEAIPEDELKTFLEPLIPDYMMPSFFVSIEEMPVTPGGKIDKKALPMPEVTTNTASYVEPVTAAQRALCEIFEKALGIERVGIEDNFFELGGSFLTASKVAVMCLSKNISLVYADIFKYPTVRELAALVDDGGVTEAAQSKNEFSDYNYNRIQNVISANTEENADRITKEKLGDIMVTGATGFLGIHVLKAFLDNYDGKVYCLVRKGKYESPEKRMMNMLMYYFDDPYKELFESRIICVDGDITSKEQVTGFSEYKFSTIINCAACVKHFAADDVLERINVQGVENLIDFCMNHQLSMTNLLLLGIRTYLSKVNNGQEDITIQNFISRRSTHDEWTSGGSRTIMFPCRTVIAPETDFLSAAYEIQNMQNRIYMHSNYDPAFIMDEMRKRYNTPEHTGYESCYLTYQPMTVKVENEMLGTIRQHAKWFANGAATKKMYLTVSHTEDGGMNFSYHYQTAHLEEHDMELLYYYMMRILFKGIAEPDMSIGEIMELV